MMHKSRTWCVAPVATSEELAEKLAEHTWCGCTGFQIGNYLFLNDATSGDGAQEYAILKKPAAPGAPHIQIESITASWMTRERLLEFISRTLQGENDDVEWAIPFAPDLESSEQHGRCHFCA